VGPGRVRIGARDGIRWPCIWGFPWLRRYLCAGVWRHQLGKSTHSGRVACRLDWRFSSLCPNWHFIVILALFDTGTVKIICESWLFVRLKGDLVPVVLDLKWVCVFRGGSKLGCYRVHIPSSSWVIWNSVKKL
jgi:hypothetical protein